MIQDAMNKIPGARQFTRDQIVRSLPQLDDMLTFDARTLAVRLRRAAAP